MNRKHAVNSILGAVVVATFAAAITPADSFAAVGGRGGPSAAGGHSSSGGGSPGSSGPSGGNPGSGNSGSGNGGASVLAVLNPPGVAVAGPPVRVRPRLVVAPTVDSELFHCSSQYRIDARGYAQTSRVCDPGA